MAKYYGEYPNWKVPPEADILNRKEQDGKVLLFTKTDAFFETGEPAYYDLQTKKWKGINSLIEKKVDPASTPKAPPSSPDPAPPPPPPATPAPVAAQPQPTDAPPECPCGAKLSEEEKNAVNWGRSNPVFQNPMLDRISNAQGKFADAKAKADNVIGVLGALGGNTGQLSTLSNLIGNMQGLLSNYKNESNRLSGLPFTGDGPDLLSLVSTVGAAINFQCALGIDGLDVGLGIGLMTENGKLKLNVAVNIHAKLDKILGGLGGTDPTMLDKLLGEINKITNELDAIAGEINGALDAVSKLYDDALNFLAQFTNINFAINFSNDPCTKFGIGFQQGILNPAFIDQARAANPLNRAANPGFGSTFR